MSTVVRSRTGWPDVAREVERLHEHLGQDRRPSRGSRRRRRRAAPTTPASRRKSRRLPSPIAAPSALGCMWMMSVPIATWTVAGMPARAAAARMLVRRNRQAGPASMAVADGAPEAHGRRRRPPRVARLRNSPVSRAMPKRPRSSPGPTSSDVRPAPRELEVVHEAGAVHRDGGEPPALDQIDDQRPEPDLDRVRAHAEDDGLARAGRPRAMRAAASRRSRAARMSGSPSRNARTLRPARTGRPSATRLDHAPAPRERHGADAGEVDGRTARARAPGASRCSSPGPSARDGKARIRAVKRRASGAARRRSTSSQMTCPIRMCVSWMRRECVLAETRSDHVDHAGERAAVAAGEPDRREARARARPRRPRSTFGELPARRDGDGDVARAARAPGPAARRRRRSRSRWRSR